MIVAILFDDDEKPPHDDRRRCRLRGGASAASPSGDRFNAPAASPSGAPPRGWSPRPPPEALIMRAEARKRRHEVLGAARRCPPPRACASRCAPKRWCSSGGTPRTPAGRRHRSCCAAAPCCGLPPEHPHFPRSCSRPRFRSRSNGRTRRSVSLASCPRRRHPWHPIEIATAFPSCGGLHHHRAAVDLHRHHHPDVPLAARTESPRPFPGAEPRSPATARAAFTTSPRERKSCTA